MPFTRALAGSAEWVGVGTTGVRVGEGVEVGLGLEVRAEPAAAEEINFGVGLSGKPDVRVALLSGIGDRSNVGRVGVGCGRQPARSRAVKTAKMRQHRRMP